MTNFKISFYEFAVALTVSIPAISDGMQFGWSAPALPLFRSTNTTLTFTPHQEFWLEELFLMGFFPGICVTKYTNDNIGRHKSVILSSVISLIGWIITAVPLKVSYFFIARLVMGIASNFIFVSNALYLSEIGNKQIRGFLVSLLYILQFVGIILVYSIVPFTPLYSSSIIAGCMLLLQLSVFIFMPETPFYLVSNNKIDQAKNSLKKLRGQDDCNKEFEEIVELVQRCKEDKGRIIDLFLDKLNVKILIKVSILVMAQHLCAFSVMIMNVHTILDDAKATLLVENISIVFATLMLIGVVLCSVLIDKIGRKIILIVSCVSSGICLFGLGIHFHLLKYSVDLTHLNWLPIIFSLSYAVTSGFGLASVPKTYSIELFPNKIRALGLTFCDGLDGIAAGASVFLYKFVAHSIGYEVAFYFFAVICIATALYTYFAIPETKGKSLDEIQAIIRQ